MFCQKYVGLNEVVCCSSCLVFMIDPLLSKNENISFNFYKKMFENIKQTKDAQCPDSEDANKVCIETKNDNIPSTAGHRLCKTKMLIWYYDILQPRLTDSVKLGFSNLVIINNSNTSAITTVTWLVILH